LHPFLSLLAACLLFGIFSGLPLDELITTINDGFGGTVGGVGIIIIAGLIIGSAFCNIPVVIDGFISGAAALVAVSLNPTIGEFLFAAHQSVEPGHKIVLDALGQKPLLDLSMRLGEGTGAALGMDIVEAGVKVLLEVLTFQEAGVQEAVR
ncbi:MAG: nicotinate-nucleotide--dimethylbenzimidazole phosphoribosyltransferase, partial [Thermodesulfobacteriota bacterium]|nr:nicotinate-nucleotide--dimethylbenzimidazole phosphoribosyltransferase [Thermodesulfobacteriota bacterium]